MIIRNRVWGDLAVTRALGDRGFKFTKEEGELPDDHPVRCAAATVATNCSDTCFHRARQKHQQDLLPRLAQPRLALVNQIAIVERDITYRA